MLENSLPLSGNTSARAIMLLQGVVPGLHISLLFGIDMAGDKDIMVPIICEEPSY